MTSRPSPSDLAAARDRTIPDVLPEPGADFTVLFCGINPGLYSAATGWHFARPGNRFWPALHLSGFTPRLLAPSEQDLLPALGLGITNLVARATAQAAELHDAELRAGRQDGPEGRRPLHAGDLQPERGPVREGRLAVLAGDPEPVEYLADPPHPSALLLNFYGTNRAIWFCRKIFS